MCPRVEQLTIASMLANNKEKTKVFITRGSTHLAVSDVSPLVDGGLLPQHSP